MKAFLITTLLFLAFTSVNAQTTPPPPPIPPDVDQVVKVDSSRYKLRVPSKGRMVDVKVDEPNPQNSIDPNKIYTEFEKAPEFPGGLEKFAIYLQQNFKLPPNSEGIHGKVLLSFVVERNGSLTDVRIASGLSPEIDKEALRVIKKGPKWHPGIWNSKPVRIAYLTHIDVPVNP
ncbi:MAG TPA: energy transducer TonB [Mucilaginibacter sp.]|jgi:protein TonB|nr:energy transducer TonB [Mucilaginibacter sp.]